ncbi:WD40/YVTN/BNR-like repeat-containing protein [Actinoplanes sp. G11-F43]|uniref:WD40/YVTN/BNR-like repeat-containing protein n=1 Tax=Actinoplanes sp. G11-F43 TaxID=3424130 RepID=UPI003D324C2C
MTVIAMVMLAGAGFTSDPGTSRQLDGATPVAVTSFGSASPGSLPSDPAPPRSTPADLAPTGSAPSGLASSSLADSGHSASSGSELSWRLTETGSTARFRGLAPVSATVAWAAGSAGTILRTTDGGRTWASVGPPEAAALQFRDIEAFGPRHAVALTIGNGTDSRIYTTTDGGTTWTETFRNDDPAAFYDCVTFLDRRNGLALSDPVDGRFRILATRDGGHTWKLRPTDGMPPALPGEFAFAASGTCLVSAAGHAWFATGGATTARVFTSRDGGRNWTVTDTPVPSGPSAGIYSLAFRDPRHGIAVGGDYAAETTAPDGSAVTRDGGRNWTVSRTVPGEYRSGAAWRGRTALTVGPTGSDVSYNNGVTWHRFDTGSFDAVACAPTGACWASGANGRIARLHTSHR